MSRLGGANWGNGLPAGAGGGQSAARGQWFADRKRGLLAGARVDGGRRLGSAETGRGAATKG